MPELPDVTIFAKNLDKLFAGKKLLKVKVVNGGKLQNTQKELSEQLEGKKLKRIYRSGKEMRFEFAGAPLLGLHLMLTGDIFAFDEKNEKRTTIVELYFEGGKNIVLTDRMGNAHIYLDPVDKAGVDALEVDYKYL